MQMMLLFWVSSQPITFSWMAPLIHWFDNKPSKHWKCLQTLSFYAIFTNLFQLNKYDHWAFVLTTFKHHFEHTIWQTKIFTIELDLFINSAIYKPQKIRSISTLSHKRKYIRHIHFWKQTEIYTIYFVLQCIRTYFHPLKWIENLEEITKMYVSQLLANHFQ